MTNRNPGTTFKFPSVIIEFLQNSPSGGESGVDGQTGYAWAFARSEILLWSYHLAGSAPVVSHRLPYESTGRHFIHVLTYKVWNMSKQAAYAEDRQSLLSPSERRRLLLISSTFLLTWLLKRCKPQTLVISWRGFMHVQELFVLATN